MSMLDDIDTDAPSAPITQIKGATRRIRLRSSTGSKRRAST